MTLTVEVPMALPSAGNLPRPWSDAEIAALREVYAQTPLRLAAFAKSIGRDKANVSRKARALGLTNQARPKGRIPKQTTMLAMAGFQGALVADTIRRHQKANGHPRGMLGKKHTAQTLAAISVSSRALWADPASGLNTPEQTQRRSDEMVRRIKNGELRQGYSRGRGGKRADLGNRYFRSAWEANYARLLDLQIKHGAIASWDFECHTFEFVGIKRGSRLYVPDFKVTFHDGHHEWHEVKGWMDQKSKTKLKRMAKYFPSEKIVVVDSKSFKAFKRQGFDRMIPTWERM